MPGYQTTPSQFLVEELETFYDLSVEDGQLVIRHRRFGPTPLTHTEGDSFSGTLPVSLVVFQRDDQGNVTGFEAGVPIQAWTRALLGETTVAVSASAEARATAASTGEFLRRAQPPRPVWDDGRVDRMI